MKTIAAIILFVLAGSSALSIEAQTKKIGMKRAREIAKRRVHGTIRSSELEKEKGRWIYSFDINTGKGKITEVNVDAYTGKVIGIEHESAKKEAAEDRQEKKEKH